MDRKRSMKGNLQRLLMGFGFAVCSILLLLVLLPYLLNLERYRGMLAEEVERMLGRKASLGRIQLTFLTGLGAEVKEVRIAEDPLVGDRPFLTAEALRVRVRLLPLLWRQVEVSQILLREPRLLLIRGREGRWNYQGTLERGQPPPPSGKDRSPKAAAKAGAAVLPLLATNLRVQQGTVEVVDHVGLKGKTLKFTGVNLTAVQRNATTPVALSLEGTIAVSPPARLRVSGRVGPLPPEGFGHLPLQASLTLQGLDLKALHPYTGKDLPLIMEGRTDLQLRGDGRWEAINFRADADLTSAYIEYPDVFRKEKGETGEFSLKGRLLANQMEVSSLQVNIKGVRFDGRGTVTNFTAPHVTFSLAASKIDLKRLLSWPTSPLAWKKAAWAAVPRSDRGQVLQGVNASGEVKIELLQWGGLKLNNLTAFLVYQLGVLQLKDLVARLHGGRLKVRGEVRAGEKGLNLLFRSRLDEVNTHTLLKALFGSTWDVQGLLSLEADLEGPSGPLRAFLNRATGAGWFLVREGRLIDFDPVEELKRLLVPFAKTARLDLDRFDQVQGTYVLQGGYLKTKDLTMIQGENRVTAIGQLDLKDAGLNFDVTASTPPLHLEAKVTGTVTDPKVVPMSGGIQRRIEMEINEGQKRKIQEFFQELLKK
ncbi:MAG: AsmA family protein [Candidatus Methylomirabilales bacterium]